MSANLLAIYCVLSSVDRISAEELLFEHIYNSAKDKYCKVIESVGIPVTIVVSVVLLIIIIWFMCWCCEELSEDSSQSIESGSPGIIKPVVIHNQNNSRIVSIQRSTSKPKGIPNGSVKTEVPKSPVKELSVRLDEQSENGQSIDANNTKQTTTEVKNETQEKSNAENTIVSVNQSQKIVVTSNQTATTQAQHSTA